MLAATLLFASTVSTAEARTSKKDQTAALRSQVRELRGQRNRLKVRLTAANATIGTLNGQVGTLTRTVAARTAERDAVIRQRDTALQTVRTLRAQIAAEPSALYTGIETVRREVAYSERVLAQAGVPFTHEQIVGQAAMSYVVGHVSAPAYGYMNEILGIRPTPTANGVLQTGAGICGHAALTFAAIVKAFGLPVRSVQFYYGQGDNHIADEVYYDGAWHYFDPTFGIYYADNGQVLSITDARSREDAESLMRYDQTLLWTTVASSAGLTSLTSFGIETDPMTRVELAKQAFR